MKKKTLKKTNLRFRFHSRFSFSTRAAFRVRGQQAKGPDTLYRVCRGLWSFNHPKQLELCFNFNSALSFLARLPRLSFSSFVSVCASFSCFVLVLSIVRTRRLFSCCCCYCCRGECEIEILESLREFLLADSNTFRGVADTSSGFPLSPLSSSTSSTSN